MNEFLKNHWYLAAPSKKIKKNKMLSVEIMAEPILFFRDSKNQVHAVRDICPHRGIPLKFGQIVNDMVECPYHGWKFDGQGTCREIPSLTEGQQLDCTKIKVKSYEVKEQYGAIWVYIGDVKNKPNQLPLPPQLAGFDLNAKPNYTVAVQFPCHIDHAVIGLMDPAHGPYIHKSWFWRSSKSAYAKKKEFGPVDFGFQMKRHKPSSNSKAYKILGGQPTTEITFTIPGTRVEHIQVGKKSFYSVTALTPISETCTLVTQMSYWNTPWISFLKPVVKLFGKIFIGQDLDAVTKQQVGLKYDPTLMLINDADTQAKWYYSLKKEWIESNQQNRSFANPVRDVTLSWKS